MREEGGFNQGYYCFLLYIPIMLVRSLCNFTSTDKNILQRHPKSPLEKKIFQPTTLTNALQITLHIGASTYIRNPFHPQMQAF